MTRLRILRGEINLNDLNGPISNLKCHRKGEAETHTEKKIL